MATHRPLVIGSTTPIAQLPSGDTIDGVAQIEIAKAGTLQGTRKRLNLIEGTNVTLTVADNSGSDQVDVTIAASGGGGGGGDSLGTGFTGGGGSGTIPGGTVAASTSGEGFCFTNSYPDYGQEFKLHLGYFEEPFNGELGIGFWGNDTVNETTLFLGASQEYGAGQSVNYSIFGANSGSTFAARVGGVNISFSNYVTGKLKEIRVTDAGIKIIDTDEIGALYDADYSTAIAANDRSLTDTGTVNLLKQTPVSYANGDAPNNCIFYSTTNSKLAYKDPGGTVNNLY
jgi:hypothetical protein